MAASLSSNSNSNIRGNASTNSTIILQDTLEDSCQALPEEIHQYAAHIGIDPIREPHLLYLAKEGLMQALPSEWKICYSEERCGPYYFNVISKHSQWDHPLDEVYRNLVEQARQNLEKNRVQQQHLQNVVNTLAGSTICLTGLTPLIDNSEDASQMDSGIRSLQCNDDGDNTNNTNEMSSPISNMQSNGGAISRHFAVSSSTTTSVGQSSSTSGFSGGVSRFLESRSKNFGVSFQPLKNTRFEIAKTHTTHINVAQLFGTDKSPTAMVTEKKTNDEESAMGGFTLSGTGAMFLKSRRQIENGLNQATAMVTSSSNIIVEGSIGVPTGVKGILRDSSLTDMRRKSELCSSECEGVLSTSLGEDKKSVRFNLEEVSVKDSPEEEFLSSPKRANQSPEVSAHSDDEEDDDPWDLDYDEADCVGIGHLISDSSKRSSNPFLNNNSKEIRGNVVPKDQRSAEVLNCSNIMLDTANEFAKPQIMESNSPNTINYLEKLKENSVVKPLYDDTDSDSKASSVRSFIINKSDQSENMKVLDTPSNNPFDLDELHRKHSHEVKQLELKLQSVAEKSSDKTVSSMKTFKVASKLVGFLKKDDKALSQNNIDTKSFLTCDQQQFLKEEKETLEEQLQQQIDLIKKEHELKLKNIRHEYDLRLASFKHEMEESIEIEYEHYRANMEAELESKRKEVVDEHKAHMNTLQQNHNEILQDLERDLKSEEELLKKEHATKLNEMKDKLSRELEMERQRMRENGDDRLYEKLRCEKRLLEDKYRCLKEKYVRLKTDVKLSLERRNRRREAQALHQQSQPTTATGSETERSISNKPSIGNSENLTLSTSFREPVAISAVGSTKTGGKPPLPPKTHLSAASVSIKDRDRPIEHSQGPQTTVTRKPGISSKYLQNLQVQDDTTSISQSDTTISNNYNVGRYLPTPILSDNGNSDSEAYQQQFNQENNNNGRGSSQRKKLFSRTKSASTSRLNSDYKCDRPCTPVENLRHQLQKLEDLEDQFPDNTLETTYHLRYPFSDISNEHAGTSSELEFFKHRIHMERDSIRRAKESLQTQRTNFRARQREIKTCHKATLTRHTLEQLIQEEKELTEMEVNLHRTRALLGEKVIRLKHLEQSLLRIYEKEKPTLDLLGVEAKDDATLSDLSSHSSSGFSSTDFASGMVPDAQNLSKRKDIYHHESSECIQNLEILNAEIREILDILGKGQSHQGGGLPLPLMSPSDLNWSQMMATGSTVQTTVPGTTAIPSLAERLETYRQIANFSSTAGSTLPNNGGPIQQQQPQQSISTLADRLEAYRQMASGRMQSSMSGAANTIVSQNPRAVNYTTSLVERTRDLRNWLRQAKNEHDLLTTMSKQHGFNLVGGSNTASNNKTTNAANLLVSNGGNQTKTPTSNTASTGVHGSSQTNI